MREFKEKKRELSRDIVLQFWITMDGITTMASREALRPPLALPPNPLSTVNRRFVTSGLIVSTEWKCFDGKVKGMIFLILITIS